MSEYVAPLRDFYADHVLSHAAGLSPCSKAGCACLTVMHVNR
jgi:hypothetical protein